RVDGVHQVGHPVDGQRVTARARGAALPPRLSTFETPETRTPGSRVRPVLARGLSCDRPRRTFDQGGIVMKRRVIQHGKGPTTAPGSSTPTEPPARRHDRKPHGRFRTAVERHPLVAVLVLAFALTWFTVPMGSFMAAGPLLASLIVLGMTEGRSGLRELWQRVVRWRVGWTREAVPLAG